ncbi:bzip transcription factor [Niveomyces insectorum RCEF 264]|uniref:Bzip transcription factor n=1 Tax=Niveomyces insectorum RCEF 264 TaxID=1081102 RepID=A0A167RI42_9HYPO|nr:bzip transcription factor [Niveomyces insectorum RCEF 264]
MADIMSIDKNDSIKHDSDDSLESSPEAEPTSAGRHDGSPNNNPLDNQPIKRKGGRKPIYATSEERKQRNRQAQAAFRERRTEYIKQLEETIRVHEQNLHNLQTAHRHAADECLMLRYKNSLLERILLEKGIDVQAELRAKTGSPNLGPTHMPQNLVQPPPLPRAILNRHHARRSNSSIAPKLEPGATSLPASSLVGVTPGHPTPTSVVTSPKSRPTPSSHSGSPTASTSAYGQSPANSASDPSASLRPIMTAPPPPPPPPAPQTQPPQQVHQNPAAAAAIKGSQLGGPMPGMVGPVPPRTVQQQRQRKHHLQQQHSALQQQQQQHHQQQQHQQPQQQQHSQPSPLPPLQQHQQPPHQQHQQQHQHQQHQQHQQHHPHHQHPQHHQHHQQQQPASHQAPLPSPQPPTPRSGGIGSAQYYPVPGFQNHIEQLEQEYEAADDMIEDPAETPDTPSGPSPYPGGAFSTGPPPMSLASPATSAGPSSSSSVLGGGAGGQNGYPSMTQLLDPALDWDPFGLSASMQFPTQFSFDTSNTR